jgi:hypothetical protein
MVVEVKKIPFEKRRILSEKDREYMSLCLSCSAREVCGPSWSVWDDTRWCPNADGADVIDPEVCIKECRILCPRSKEKVSYYAKSLGPKWYRVEDGVAIPDLEFVGHHPWNWFDLSYYPDVGFQINGPVHNLYQPLYVVSFKKLFRQESCSWARKRDLKVRHMIPPESALAVTFTTHDWYLDYWEHDLKEMIRNCSEYGGVDFWFGVNFSVYDNYPRFDHLYRFKQKFVAMDYMQEFGMRVIPSIAFYTKTDLERYAKWLRDNQCHMVMFNFQTNSVSAESRNWKAHIMRAVKLREAVGHRLHLFAFGVNSRDRLESLFEAYGPDFTLLDASSYRKAEFHSDIYGNYVEGVEDVIAQFEENAMERRRLVASVKQRDPVPSFGHRLGPEVSIK